MKIKVPTLIAAAALLVTALSFALPYIDLLPSHVHAWAQADWYALSLGFLDNGFDLFHPQTYVFNKQFPGWWAIDYGDGITSVDMPLHQYIIAALMSLFGTTSPWVFRCWTLLCSLVGLWFIYLTAHRLSASAPKSLLVALIACTSPLYAYYFANYLPSAPALSLASVGLWAYVRHRQQGQLSLWWLSIVMLTLATLTRTSQAVLLVAVICFEALRSLHLESRPWPKALALLPSAAAIFASLAWNAHLRANHGSLFLGHLEPPSSFQQAFSFLDDTCSLWANTYFSPLQRSLLIASLLLALIAILWRKRRASRKPTTSRLSLAWLAAIWLFGELLFAIAMLKQFVDHDYYFLDSFFLPLLFLLMLALARLPRLRRPWMRLAALLCVILLSQPMRVAANHNLHQRINNDANDDALLCNADFAGSAQWLDALGVPPDATITALFSYPQNVPFIHMHRPGYSIMFHDTAIIDAAGRFPADYIVMQNRLVPTQFDAHPQLCGRLRRLASNATLSLYRLEDTIVSHSASQLLGLEHFVVLDGNHFAIDGKPWFPLMLNYKAFMRTVNDSLEVVPAPWYGQQSMQSHFDTIASWGFNSIRVCLDAIDEGDMPSMIRATQRMLQRADSAGLRVMLLIKPPFPGFWADYAVRLMQSLSDMPVLWAYDLMNEPLYFDPAPQREKADAVAIVEGWRQIVRQHAPRQLFTVATAEPIEVFEWDPSMLPVDFVEMHTYHPLRFQAETWWYSHICNKPWMIGETGLPADNISVPYTDQARFMDETFRYAVRLGAAGYGWWEFQDYPTGINYEAQYTGLRDSLGRRKPSASLPLRLRSLLPTLNHLPDTTPPANYYNMLAYSNVAVTGRVVDGKHRPIPHAVVRGWNDDWSIGQNTFTDSLGRFRLVSNDICTHFEVSAPHRTRIKFDHRLSYVTPPSPLRRSLEYQQLPLTGWGSDLYVLPTDPNRFSASLAPQADLGVLTLLWLSP